LFASNWNFKNKETVLLSGVPAGHDARVVSEIAKRAALSSQPALVIVQDDIKASVFSDALSFFNPDLEIIVFPAWDCLPYDRVSPHSDVVGIRIQALARLAKNKFSKPVVIITTVNAVVQKLLPPEITLDCYKEIRIGDTVNIDKLCAFLVQIGYTHSSTVRETGEFSLRGGILDIFPAGQPSPVRIDFFDDEVEALRVFDALTQTTIEKTDLLEILPASEIIINDRTVESFRNNYRSLFGAVIDKDPLYEAISNKTKWTGSEHWLGLFYPKLYSLFDYVPNAVIFLDYQVLDAVKARIQQIEDFYNARFSMFEAEKKSKNRDLCVSYKPAPIDSLYLSLSQINEALKLHALAYLYPFSHADAIDCKGEKAKDFAASRASNTLYSDVKAYIEKEQRASKRVAIACYSVGASERIAGILRTHGISAQIFDKSFASIKELDTKLVNIIVLGLEHGFTSPDFTLISEQDILGDRLIRNTPKRKVSKHFRLELETINIGDYLVHSEHGIGRYEGLETLTVLGISHDCVRLVYEGGDKLFVPVENLELLTRYASQDDVVKLDKLGSLGWQQRKSRVKKRLKDMADALMRIAAERELRTGEVIQSEPMLYQEFASRFPYAETEDQDRAISEVLSDLSSGKPMDRLVCGDVGFGKTEVAIRAAFAAVQAGFQVAIVVPTTLLARQHFYNFQQRFQGFPIRVAQLSRMVSLKEAKAVKDELKNGTVDIVIGTHALLSSDIAFKSLGLVIIDEEQHFGVKQKEKLKNLKSEVHVLTLTATPIPRTLQLALAGVRELSLITTPPIDRLSVHSFVLPFDPLVIREAIMREHYRGGQVFYVCPYIEDIAHVAETLKELVPEVKVVEAHGRLSPSQLDKVMTAFDARQFDVLLSTNIVESGLDIPNANTIILHHSDRFGLAGLYQLRGRVGRAKQRGYAYFTYDNLMPITKTAQQRLEVIQTLEQLGAGFQIASHDMDIRGSGNILGEEQSGHIKEVGIELYQQMLEDAVALARANKGAAYSEAELSEDWTPQINIGIPYLYLRHMFQI